MNPGDKALFYFTAPESSIHAIGRIATKPERDPSGESSWYLCDFSDVNWLRKPLSLPIRDCKRFEGWWKKKPYRHSHKLDQNIARLMWDKVTAENSELSNDARPTSDPDQRKPADTSGVVRFEEGKVSEIVRELRSRNPQLRAKAATRYGTRCMVCEFDFVKVYGPIAEGFFELHHLRPLSSRPAGLTKLEDVIVVCANCHRMLHRQSGEPMDWKVLQRRVRANRRHAR